MSLDDPSPEVVRAVEAAVAWFETAKLTGIRVASRRTRRRRRGGTRWWSRTRRPRRCGRGSTTIGTNKPIFADRDGVPKPALAEIGYERRNGYAWYGTWPQKLLEVEYPAWKKKRGG